MLIQTMQPLRSLSPKFKMDVKRTQGDSAMSLNTMLADPSKSPQGSNNPMDIRTMLNPSPSESETSYSNLESQTSQTPPHQYSIPSPTSDRGEQQLYLPPIKLEPSEPAHHQSTLPFHLRAGNPSPPQSPHSAGYQQQAFTPTFNDNYGYPTPPPSSPQDPVFHQPEYQSNYTGPLDSHPVNWRPTASLSPRRRPDQERRVRDPYWNVPVQVHNIRISHSSPYHSHPRTTASSRRGNNRVTKPSKRTHIVPHSNKPYTGEQVHWMRYHREDLVYPWPKVHAKFYRRFPGEVRESVACITSRYYRSNLLPDLDENGEAMVDRNGKFVMLPAKVRQRATKEGKPKPFLFLEMHPEWALVYDWVIPEDKAKAMRVLQVLDDPIIQIATSEEKSEKYRNYQRALRKIDGKSQELAARLAQVNGTATFISSKL